MQLDVGLLFNFLVSGAFSKPLKVLTTSDDLTTFTDGSGARLRNPPDIQLVDATVCLRFYDFFLMDRMLISSKYDHDDNMTPIFAIDELSTPKRQLWYGLWYGAWKKVESDFSLLTWHHICWCYENSTSTIRMVIDGDVVLDQVDMELLKKPMSIPCLLYTSPSPRDS